MSDAHPSTAGPLAGLSPRKSFRSKLLIALLGSVGLLVSVTLLVVRQQTARQVERVTREATEKSRQAFNEVEAFNRERLARLASAFTGSIRTRAALEAALDAGDRHSLYEDASYELQRSGVQQSLAAFTDAESRPIVTLLNGRMSEDPDPARIASLSRRVLEEGRGELLSYRVVDGRLFTVQVALLELAGRRIGTVAFGLPLGDEEARRLGEIVGAEVCFVVDRRCVAGTEEAKATLVGAMIDAVGRPASRRVDPRGRRWEVVSEELGATPAGEHSRVIAIPLEGVLAPFDRIHRTLAFGGLGVLLLAILGSVVLSRGLTKPVLELVEATERVAGGDYGSRVTVRSQDELGVLAESFNEMTEGLLLKEQYRGVLDKVVSREVAEELLKGEVALGGEIREVTTLFADITAFSALTEGMGPQRVIGLLNESMERLAEAVEGEGGVVDKFVGDGLMAIFGAPMPQEDHALRAVRSGLRMQEAMDELNRKRSERDEDPIHVAVGVHSGPVVAGNMGSQRRLNYTVVGESVNLASRICDAAGPGQVVVSNETHRRVQDRVATALLGERTLKGFSRAQALWTVESLTRRAGEGGGDEVRRRRSPGGPALLLTAALLAVGAPALTPPSAVGQTSEGGLPILRDLGISYLSPSGLLQVDVSGRLDLEGYLPGPEAPGLVTADGPFLAPRLRLFTDVFLGDHVYGLVEIRSDRGPAPTDGDLELRLEQLFLRLSPDGGGRLALQVGRFVSPFGGYPSRHHTVDDPLIRPPLMYDYRTMICPGLIPPNTAAFVPWKDDPDRFRPIGAPVVWGAPYPWGAMLLGSLGPVSARVAMVNSAPSSEPDEWSLGRNDFDAPSWTASVGWRVRPELHVVARYNRGPYLKSGELEGPFPEGGDRVDYVQEIWGVEGIFALGDVVLRGEAFADRWEVPNVPDDPRDLSWYLEGALTLAPGLFAAGRYGAIHYSELALDAGGREPWDYRVERWQIGWGYRILPNLELRAEYGATWLHGPSDPRDDLVSMQVWWEF